MPQTLGSGGSVLAINWQNLATAVVCSLEFEHLCSRGSFLDEHALVRTAVEYVQAATILRVEPEINHVDLPGDQRLDAAGRVPGHAYYAFVLEAKWLKSGGGTRQWGNEIVRDILRLEMLQQDINPKTERALLIAGHRSTTMAFRNKKVQTGGGTEVLFPHILQHRVPSLELPQNQSQIRIRECDPAIRRFWKEEDRVYHCISYRDGSTPVDVDCPRRGCGSWGPQSMTARL